jgi:carboxypeptidase Taq
MSKIRVYADELTYPLHIILRFEMEQALLENKYDIKELNSIWNEKILEYLGLEIKNDSEGIMQDIHWATSFYGYFPTYALGNLYNSQMYFTMKKELDFEGLLQSGHIRPIREWLTEKVHRKTGFYDPKEFIENITGEELNPNYFIKYLEEKYEYFLN